MESVTLNISGMACGGCSSTVQKALLALDGVISAEVSHVEARAEIHYDPARVQLSQMQAAVEQAGYRVIA